ncbi:MAG: hypothetical protein V3U65_06525 [Granulosicoccaceae bacterium]
MKPDHLKSSWAVIMPLVFTVACGGGSSSNTPEAGEANAAGTTEQIITGRVADGYLQGAVVCIDINENGHCNPDEPQVESGEGGSYALGIPANGVGKPVIAEVPATAIDEDTGMPFGKELVLSTPGDRPQFVSPITTLVHQELKNNPNLNTEDAAAAVLETLGLPGEEDSTLFTDYIVSSNDVDEQKSEKFKFLHQTARVVASMMDEIHADVEAAASAQGIDVDSEATAAAIRDLVREEIRAQLPNISAAVADRILQIEESAQAGNGEAVGITDELDPDSIAGSLGDRDLTMDIADKIEAVKNEAPVRQAKMNELLAAGIYIIDVDCERLDEHGPEDGLVEPVIEQTAVKLSDEGVPEVVNLPDYCTAEYTHVITEAIIDSAVDAVVASAANLIVTHYYYGFDDATGSDGWIMSDQTREERPHLLTLVNGDWTPVEHEGPYGVVEFTADGAAVMNTDEGKLLVYASSRDLSGKSVLHHILNRGANDSLASLVDESKNFPDDSKVHQLHIKRNASLIVMFNWYPDSDDADIDQCAEFAGNCNVVHVKDEASYSPMPLASLGDLYDGAVINAVAYDKMRHLPVDVALHVKPVDAVVTATNKITSDTGPVSNDKRGGTASWTVSPRDSGIEPVPGTRPEEPKECVEEISYSDEGVEVPPTDEEMRNPDCALRLPEISTDLARNDFTTDGTVVEHAEEVVIGESRWYTVSVQGVDMVVIEVPVSVRHRLDEDDMAELLLIQNGEFVRRGARIGERSVDDETAYNAAAFDTLLPVIVDYVKPPSVEPRI